ncbi:hypothetical protein C1H46_029226 [Malus baccata]|uniref:Uncharacterized protein n=1 Tax=Malus baccata TaxID=106549 RepID=A0A540LFE9_MALBA|nr:hypothetical protein C1H46_029226 [Malus baccata]
MIISLFYGKVWLLPGFSAHQIIVHPHQGARQLDAHKPHIKAESSDQTLIFLLVTSVRGQAPSSAPHNRDHYTSFKQLKQVHAQMLRTGLLSDPYSANKLLTVKIPLQTLLQGSSWFGRVAPFLTLRLYKAEPPSSKLKPCSFAASSPPSAPPTSSQIMLQHLLFLSLRHGASLSSNRPSEL